MDLFLDKSWVKLNRAREEYRNALVTFLDHAFATSAVENKIACPCGNCANRFYHERELVMKHMIMKGMDIDYQKCIWVFHGEPRVCDGDRFLHNNSTDVTNNACDNDILRMVEDAFEFREPSSSTTPSMNDEEKTFFELIDDAKQPLYPGCEEFSKLSFIVEMYHLKCLYEVSNVGFDAFVKLFKRALPKDSTLPNSFNQIQTIIKKLGLDYKKIDVCPNDCVLFWKEKIVLDKCLVCDELRWKTTDDGSIIKLASGQKVPKKVLRHFPLIPRYPTFSSDARNVRLGLSSDGFNPFGMMSSQYNIWPVVLMAYNLPPWLCMKQSYFMLSLIIPGPKGPSNDIDVFLEPLIDELQLLWEVGVDTFDASKGETFRLYGALLWTINDFPAYDNLSGWKIKGKCACP
ncbi:uncharacterized protein [Spinacia oleracea]|uniref:Transposase-associated domain-containing protein n=1 Tax=Spinacia oleracea TaxID=3562 RepID=A0ABM3R257_SPIOL|nr:uncharacterized protein LOC110803680 [Spinacia oleracea]